MKQRGEFEVERQSLSYLPALICGVGRKGFKQTSCWSSYAQLRRNMRGRVERRSEEGHNKDPWMGSLRRRGRRGKHDSYVVIIDLMKGHYRYE